MATLKEKGYFQDGIYIYIYKCMACEHELKIYGLRLYDYVLSKNLTDEEQNKTGFHYSNFHIHGLPILWPVRYCWYCGHLFTVIDISRKRD